MSDLTDTRALVTGATSGLGLAMARALAGAGAHTIMTSRDADRAQRAAAEIGGQTTGVALDVRDEEAVGRVIGEIEAAYDGIDILVNNAGIGMRTVNPRFMSEPQAFWQVSAAGFRAVLETKATGCFLVASAVIPGMLKRGSGRIVNISMNTGTMVRRGFVPYGPAGAAVEALSRVMAADLADTPIRVNMLLPGGATLTGMIPDGAGDEVRSQLLDPSIMGPPIVWLASAEATDVHDARIVAAEFGDVAPA